MTIPDKVTASKVGEGLGEPFSLTSTDLGSAGYVEEEFFFEGGAWSYAVQGGMTGDGKWSLSEKARAAFKSRLLVRRPSSKQKFNGTVVVEWLNVSGGLDGDPGFIYNSPEIMREGYAWVGVSAQAVGIEGGGFSFGIQGAQSLKQFNPMRYGSLKHPGDAFSYDIFTQAARVIRNPESDVLGGLKPARLIGYGESQSAGRMVSYVNGVHPLAKQYDGYFIHSRGAAGAAFEDSLFGGFGAAPSLIRDDITAKVFQFQTETDVAGALASSSARQPDSDRVRTWEVAGTSHIDQYNLDIGEMLNSSVSVNCPGANSGPQFRVIRAALHSLDEWIRDGTEPARGEPIMMSNGVAVRDQHGNALGGVRTPDVDVPIKTLSGDPAGGGDFVCFLFGSTVPFTSEQLMELYPTHEDYVMQVKASARETREARFVLEPEEKGFVEDAEAAAVPN